MVTIKYYESHVSSGDVRFFVQIDEYVVELPPTHNYRREAYIRNIIEKQAEDPSPFRGGDECRTLFSHPIAIYPLGYI